MSLLLFEAGVGAPKAVPMALVTRLEQISTEAIEWAGDQAVTQYRGKLMPLASVDGNPIAIRDGRRPVLVFSDGERTMGLVVDRVVDTIETRVALERQGGHNGVLGSAIIAGKSTELLDVGYLVNRVFGGWFGGREHEPFRSVADDPKSVLLVDDSPFIRNLMAPLLRAEGYRVTLASSPIEALRLRDAGTMFDAVVSDIEMPEMDGFAFAAACRASGPWRETPFIALTSHVTPQDIGRSRGAGFDHHVGKLEKDGLFKFLAATTSHPRKAA
jgi:two-component system chemotaxis sensor kinase CheA